MRRSDPADGLVGLSAFVLALAVAFWVCGDLRAAAWVSGAGALSALAAVFWRDQR